MDRIQDGTCIGNPGGNPWGIQGESGVLFWESGFLRPYKMLAVHRDGPPGKTPEFAFYKIKRIYVQQMDDPSACTHLEFYRMGVGVVGIWPQEGRYFGGATGPSRCPFRQHVCLSMLDFWMCLPACAS